MKKIIILAALLAASLAGCAGINWGPPSDPKTPFDFPAETHCMQIMGSPSCHADRGEWAEDIPSYVIFPNGSTGEWMIGPFASQAEADKAKAEFAVHDAQEDAKQAAIVADAKAKHDAYVKQLADQQEAANHELQQLAKNSALAASIAHKTHAFAYSRGIGNQLLLTHSKCPVGGEGDSLGIMYGYSSLMGSWAALGCWGHKTDGDADAIAFHVIFKGDDGKWSAAGGNAYTYPAGAFMQGDPRPTRAFE
ncbi:hypothetical protein [Paraburkholderia bryophila]|uniref:Uncharacterized protein YdbL (DUF1318 family) n=1 Tax=Paraburkholderia bryophila TaxID=420952 RepID=A0A7Y9WPG4_9BURK|nr:hypothetical protein [Paraburkholderia bryophila]NYH24657.1 uncharacterized protein YdbL (DUF1318 family) [Paraburkholderia bryophila]